ncbi:MAG TPA: VOC family protein [Candidatus Binatia bacterium]|jgi:catechol 2,3-dioxygenase-like lactoylglutathione lyase family enzyme
MARIRHLAIRTENPEKLAAFYKEVFAFEEIHRGSHSGVSRGKTVHLTDGYFELAILDNSAQQSPNGLYHFGVQIDDLDDTIARVRKQQPDKPVKKRPEGTPYAEMRVSDPEGNLIDLSVHGFLERQPLKKA